MHVRPTDRPSDPAISPIAEHGNHFIRGTLPASESATARDTPTAQHRCARPSLVTHLSVVASSHSPSPRPHELLPRLRAVSRTTGSRGCAGLLCWCLTPAPAVTKRRIVSPGRLVQWRRQGSDKPYEFPSCRAQYAEKPARGGDIQAVACASDWPGRQPCGT